MNLRKFVWNNRNKIYLSFFLLMVVAVSAAIMLAPNALTLIGGVGFLVILSTEFQVWKLGGKTK